MTVNLREIEERVAATLDAASPWRTGDTVVVAVSGGADSLCLLHLLRALEPHHGGRLQVAHLDHRFRGADSAAEAARVAQLARDWGLPVTVAAADVAGLARQEGLSDEEAARRARYRFLAQTAAATAAAAIALGHTADDQAETVLMHLLRGSGLQGLRGMRPAAPPAPWMVAGLALPHSLCLARPLLGLTRTETMAYCAAHGLAPAQDAWNEDPRFLRVRLRREVLPLLETINPRVRQALLRLAELAAWQEEDLEEMLDARWPALATEQDEVVRLDLAGWAELPRTLRLLALRRAVRQVRGHVEGLGWEAVVAAGRPETLPLGGEVALVEDVVARREYQALAVGRRTSLERPSWPDLGPELWPLQVPGRTELPDGCVLVADWAAPGESDWQEAGPLEAWVDAAACPDRLWLRARRPGDRFYPLGMAGQKKVQDFFVDAKIPRAERARVPLVVSPRGIVWVVGHRLDERFRVRPGSRRLLHLRWEHNTRVLGAQNGHGPTCAGRVARPRGA